MISFLGGSIMNTNIKKKKPEPTEVMKQYNSIIAKGKKPIKEIELEMRIRKETLQHAVRFVADKFLYETFKDQLEKFAYPGDMKETLSYHLVEEYYSGDYNNKKEEETTPPTVWYAIVNLLNFAYSNMEAGDDICDVNINNILFYWCNFGWNISRGAIPSMLFQANHVSMLSRAFSYNEIKTLRDLTNMTETEFRNCRGIGPKLFEGVKTFLTNHGLSFKEEVK